MSSSIASFKQLSLKLKEFIESEYSAKLSGKDAIKLDGKTVHKQNFIKLITKDRLDAFEAFVGIEEYAGHILDIRKENPSMRELECLTEVIKKFYDDYVKYLRKQKEREDEAAASGDVYDSQIDGVGSFNWDNYIPLLDIKTTQKIMYNLPLNLVDTRLSYESWYAYVMTRSSEEKKIRMQTAMSAEIEYNPLKVTEREVLEDLHGNKYNYINAHIIPKWRKEGIGKGKPLPEDFKRLMEHLFPNELCREYVYFWMHTMLTKVNATYLLLHGEQGIGKNTLVYIMRELVGVHNYVLISTDFWESRFNGELLYKRLAFFDETIVNEDNIQKIKTLTNSTLSIERKNCEPVNVQNFCSYVITNNLDKVNHITYDDRRYSVPVLTEKRLVDAFDQVWIDDMYNRVETDEEFIGAIGHWLIENGNSDKFKSTQPYKSDYFFQIVEKALKVWQRALIELIESGEYDEIPISSIQDILKGTGSPKIQGFLTSHRDKDGDYYGHVSRHFKGERFIKVAPKYNVNGDTTISKAYEKHKVIKLDVESEIDDLEF